MSRTCTTCQHLKRPEIDRRLAAGEPAAQVARDYDLNPSSVHRHRVNCLGLASANAIKKEAARGTAAMALLPSKEELGSAYRGLTLQIDEIVAQAKAEGSLKIAIAGLNSLRQTLDSMSRLAGHNRTDTGINVSMQTDGGLDAAMLAERLMVRFDHWPEVRAEIAQALLEIDDERAT
jgi:hypothetical protein